jgi:hypothetical protein
MTETEWTSCEDPAALLAFLGDRATERKLRLFAVACCRPLRSPLYQERNQTLLALAERLADGQAGRAELDEARRIAYTMGHIATIRPEAEGAVTAVLSALAADRRGKAAQSGYLRELFGNPFRPVAVDPAWLAWNGGTVVQLARTIYEERRFADLPVLADALEEAGCTDAALLGHCRGGGDHARGCWAVDAVLGKT